MCHKHRTLRSEWCIVVPRKLHAQRKSLYKKGGIHPHTFTPIGTLLGSVYCGGFVFNSKSSASHVSCATVPFRTTLPTTCDLTGSTKWMNSGAVLKATAHIFGSLFYLPKTIFDLKKWIYNETNKPLRYDAEDLILSFSRRCAVSWSLCEHWCTKRPLLACYIRRLVYIWMMWSISYLLADIGPLPMIDRYSQGKKSLMYGPSNPPIIISTFLSVYRVEWATGVSAAYVSLCQLNIWRTRCLKGNSKRSTTYQNTRIFLLKWITGEHSNALISKGTS